MDALVGSVTSACLFESDDSPANLDALLDLVKLQTEPLLADQRPKLRLVVKDEIVVTALANLGVVTGHRDVSHPDLALVPTADSDAVVRHVLDHHHVIGLVRNTLQHEVVANGPLDGEQLE